LFVKIEFLVINEASSQIRKVIWADGNGI